MERRLTPDEVRLWVEPRLEKLHAITLQWGAFPWQEPNFLKVMFQIRALERLREQYDLDSADDDSDVDVFDPTDYGGSN